MKFVPQLCVSVVEWEIKARPCLQVMDGRMGSSLEPHGGCRQALGKQPGENSGILWGCRSYWLLAVTGHGIQRQGFSAIARLGSSENVPTDGGILPVSNF